MTAGTTNVFVCCDLLKHILVGNIRSLLVHIVHRKSNVRQRKDSMKHVIFNPVQHVWLQKKRASILSTSDC